MLSFLSLTINTGSSLYLCPLGFLSFSFSFTFYLSVSLSLSSTLLLMPHFSCCYVAWRHHLLPSPKAPSIKLKLASLNRGYLLTKPTSRRSFESSSLDVSRLGLIAVVSLSSGNYLGALPFIHFKEFELFWGAIFLKNCYHTFS